MLSSWLKKHISSLLLLDADLLMLVSSVFFFLRVLMLSLVHSNTSFFWLLVGVPLSIDLSLFEMYS